YLRLVQIKRDSPFYQSNGALCFSGEEKNGQWITGFDQLVQFLGVAPATARKALEWMKGKGIIGYLCPKGFPTRIWLNHAETSITTKQTANSNFSEAKSGASFFCAESTDVPTFKEDHAHGDNLSNTKPHALSSAAAASHTHISFSQEPKLQSSDNLRGGILGEKQAPQNTEEIKKLTRVVGELERKVAKILPDCAMAVRAEIDDQMELQFNKIRRYLAEKALPQAARTGQQEAYKILRRYGAIASETQEKQGLYVGSSKSDAQTKAVSRVHLTQEKATEIAASIWLESRRLNEPIDKTFKKYLWLWEAQQQFDAKEIELLKKSLAKVENKQNVCYQPLKTGSGNLGEKDCET
ncbi:MAG TPA: hypothetical protein VEF04_21120, partial [Blastocatellia bacterium]|nr:hypothetical protein [Blastocatellia bacterium]